MKTSGNSLINFLCILILALGVATTAHAQVWSLLWLDAKGDGRDQTLPDLATLSYRYDKDNDVIWFRLHLYGIPNPEAFGVNVAIDTGGDDATKLNWWGANKSFRFDRLVTAWVTRQGHSYKGIIGVGDAEGVKSKQFNNLSQNNIDIRTEGESIVFGVKRTQITDKTKFSLLAATGSSEHWNDDIPDTGSLSVDLAAVRPKLGLREVDVSRNNFIFPAGFKTLGDNTRPTIKVFGKNGPSLILIPGMYSGKKSYDEFISRYQSQYKIFVLTPPGLNGTLPRKMPQPNTSFAEMTWIRLLERDIMELIKREKLVRPVIFAERQPGSVAAIELARKHPSEIGGIVLVGSNPNQFFSSPKDPQRKTAASPEERVALVDELWAPKWFKFVTHETWLNNDMPPQFLASLSSNAQSAIAEIEAAPLEVKIRYLCEYWASDITADLARLQVPTLVLVPGFDEKFLAEPANRSLKMTYQDPWDAVTAKQSAIEVVKVPDARLLILTEQPEVAGRLIHQFLQKLPRTTNPG
jgi:pimeloyl-ACP methyl ester carboxylesterase